MGAVTTTEPAPLAVLEDSAPTTRLRIPGFGTLELSRPELAFVGGIAVMGVLGLLDWPIALVLGAGHLLASDRSNRSARALGQAMEEAE
jgi:hypothetical protein